MKKLIASAAATAMLAGGLVALAAVAPAAAETAASAASATCEVLSVDLAGYAERPVVGEPQLEVANPAYVPAVPAVAEVSHVDVEYQTIVKLFPLRVEKRWAHKDSGATVIYDWRLWFATGKTAKHVDVAAVPAKPAVGEPTMLVDNPDFVAADAVPNTVTVTVDGTEVSNEAFGTGFAADVPLGDRGVRHAWSVEVTAWNDADGSAGLTRTIEGLSTACITPVAPTWVDECGVANNGHWVVPEVVGATYRVTDHSTLNGKVGIVATANDGYVFDAGRVQWTRTQDDARCGKAVPAVVFMPEVCTPPAGYGLGTITPASLQIANPDGVKLLVKRKSDGAAITDPSSLAPGHYDVIATVKNEAADAFTSVPAGWTTFVKDGHVFKVALGIDVVAAEPCDDPAPVAQVAAPTVIDQCGVDADTVVYGESVGGTWKVASRVTDAPGHEGTVRHRVVFTPTDGHVLPAELPGDGFVVDGKAVWLLYPSTAPCEAAAA
ncbi:hypothetical protein [Agromyces sp. LHK192]|uniref:hypothetical protein n=1 Tax=Agromyces sp. LHK192 TaxID=2498704 RepID=UPI000FD7DA8F|nr:hypothetical protein [Agromyces sp. LHK192]